MKQTNVLNDTKIRAIICADLGVSQQSLTNWKQRGIPAEYCPRIEALTGVRCEDLRPDVQWSVLRNTTPAPQEVA